MSLNTTPVPLFNGLEYKQRKKAKQSTKPQISVNLSWLQREFFLNGAKIMSYFPLQQTQIPDYAELSVKFLDALIDTYLPGID